MKSRNSEVVIVTGSSGYLGEKVVKELVSLGFEVIEIDISNTSNPVNLESSDFSKNLGLPEEYMLIHMAFPLPGSLPKRKFAKLISKININLTESLSPERTLFISSTAVYPLDADGVKTPHPWEIYGFLKLESEHSMRNSFKELTVFRPGTLIESSRSSQMVKFIKQLMFSPIPIIPGSGDYIHPFTHTDDLVASVISWASNRDAEPGVFDLVAPNQISLNEIRALGRSRRTLVKIRVPRFTLRHVGVDSYPLFGISKWHFSGLTYNYSEREVNFYNSNHRNYIELFNF